MSISPKLPRLWHGGDYNPDQWPEAVRLDDVRLMRLAHVNVASVGIFSWSQLEPRPGEYDWQWLDETFDRLYDAGVYVALATPSAAHPRWMTALYPEVQAVGPDRHRMPHGTRQRWCPTSPIYRRETARMNRALAERYGQHPGLLIWHVSNEYSNSCWCDLCAEAFRQWAHDRYGDLDTLNAQWWSAFWSHRFSDWPEIIPPYPAAGVVPDAMALDWKRFRSIQTCEFFKHEASVLRAITPDVPITTNLMGFFPGLNYAPFADAMDVISWDSYPLVTGNPVAPAFAHAYMRGLKANKPWILMEQTPSATNWQEFSMLKPPDMFRLWSWQAIAHGSDASMYFQWRRSRGGHEKFHGAVVEHEGTEKPRVFQEVAALGDEMDRLSARIVGTAPTTAKVGILWDQENRWALEGSCGPGRNKQVVETVQKHFKAVWRQGIQVDVVRMDGDWSQYQVLIAPLLYMLRSGEFPKAGTPEELHGRVDEGKKIADFVANGGTFVTTYLSGIVNESDLVYEGGYPGPLRKVLGIWAEEIDVTPPGQFANTMVLAKGAVPGMAANYTCDRYFDLMHAEGAEVLATYGARWYAGRPCLTRNHFGQGLGYYIAADAEESFLTDLYRAVAAEAGVAPALTNGSTVEVIERVGEDHRLLFLLNHETAPQMVDLGDITGTDLLTGEALQGVATMEPHGVRVLEVSSRPDTTRM